MPDALVLTDLVAGRADAPARDFACLGTADGRDAACVRVAGELDMATAPQLELMLREPRLDARLVVLDLRELAFMDCSGTHAIVDASIRARRRGRRLLLVPGSFDVERMFALTASSEHVEIGDLTTAQPLVRALLQPSEKDRAS